jgi:23S rRNA (guanosine2251-2'-O)-methyltransferase
MESNWKNVGGEGIDEIKILAQKLAVPINTVPIEKLHSLTRSNHQGVIAINSMIQYHDLQESIDLLLQSGAIPLFVMLDGITDVRNIGAIARTAMCCGVQIMIIPDKGIAALNEEAVKTSAGALQKIIVCRVNSLLKAVDTLHFNDISVFTAEMKAEKKVIPPHVVSLWAVRTREFNPILPKQLMFISPSQCKENLIRLMLVLPPVLPFLKPVSNE